jgi:hypothetical protein
MFVYTQDDIYPFCPIDPEHFFDVVMCKQYSLRPFGKSVEHFCEPL